MATVKLVDISKRFGFVEALKRVNLDIRNGELFAILGPSGCGKTTLLRIIAGLEKPTTGKVYFDGEDLTNVPAEYRDVAMVFQFYALYPTTVYNNIALPLKSRKYPRNIIDERVKEIAKKLGIEDKIHMNVDKLNISDKQRVALARAMAREPKLYLLDEPLTILDPVSRIIMRSEIKRIQKELNQTIIYVTHDQIEALTLADRVAVMNFGIVEQVGSPSEIYNNPANVYVGWFVGEPGMNFIETKVDNEGLRVNDLLIYKCKSLAEKLRQSGYEKILIGFRTENVTLLKETIDPGSNIVMRSKINVIEFFGTHYILSLEIKGQDFKVKLDLKTFRKLNIDQGEEVYAIINPAYINLYDPDKKSRIVIGE